MSWILLETLFLIPILLRIVVNFLSSISYLKVFLFLYVLGRDSVLPPFYIQSTFSGQYFSSSLLASTYPSSIIFAPSVLVCSDFYVSFPPPIIFQFTVQYQLPFLSLIYFNFLSLNIYPCYSLLSIHCCYCTFLSSKYPSCLVY
jgi:hypothetical protein